MGTIISQHAAAQSAMLVPASKGEITVADILSSSGDHSAGASDRYYHHQWAVILVTRGGYRVGLDSPQAFDAEAGDMVIMRPETDHIWTTADHPRGRSRGVAASFVLLRPPPRIEILLLRLPEIRPHYSLQRIGQGQTWRRMVRCFRQMEAICESSVVTRAELQLNLLEQALLWAAAEARMAADPMDVRVRQVIDAMASRLSEPLTIEEICRVAGVSRSQLAAIFVPATGLTPMRYLEKLRLERAMQLLRMTSRKIDSIAMDVGFCDAKHFAKRFRAVVGTTPTVYRQARHE
ncbi:MAG: helix-turn-helix domain-containing protein [Planctomycetia bacterium]